MRGVALVLTLSLAVLSGCAQKAPASSGFAATVPLPPAPADPWVETSVEGSLLTTTVFDAQSAVHPGTPFQVPSNATHILVEGTVSTAVPDEVRIRLLAQDCGRHDTCELDAQTVGGHFTVEDDDPAAGAWSVRAFAVTAAQSGSYSLVVRAFVPPS